VDRVSKLENLRILVVGCGSIGSRHISNLKSFFPGPVEACDLDTERLSFINEKYGAKVYTDLREALEQKFDAVIISTPPSSHIPIALTSIEHDTHLFIEKPLSNTLDGIKELLEKGKKSDKVIFVGYNFRFHPGIRLVKDKVDSGEIGKILSATAEFGQYLPDWRPWQDYRKSYTAGKNLGGGIILDGSHEIDYIRWFLGEVKEVTCFAAKISSLDVETEDVAKILLKFKSGAIAGIHLDFVQRGYTRTCKLIGEEGTIEWSFLGQSVKVYSKDARKWQTLNINVELNDMYINEMKHFIRCIRGEEKPMINGEEGRKTLEVALAAKKSAITGKLVKL